MVDGLVGWLGVGFYFLVVLLILYLVFQFLVQKLKIQLILVFFFKFFVLSFCLFFLIFNLRNILLSQLLFLHWKLSRRDCYYGTFLEYPWVGNRTHHRLFVESVLFQHFYSHLPFNQPFAHELSGRLYVIVNYDWFHWWIFCLNLIQIRFCWSG